MFISFFLCSLFNVIVSAQAYLNTILERLECIQSASYIDLKEAWEPGDTEPVYATPFYTEEYRNPSDTVIGSSYLSWDSVGKRRFEGGYDGTVSASMFLSSTPSSSICAMRYVIIRVFPDPAPAMMRRGPSILPAAAACSGFRTFVRSVFIQMKNLPYCLVSVNC